MTAATRPPRRGTTTGRIGRAVGAAVLVVAAALVTDFVVADVVADRRQDALRAQLDQQWQQDSGPGARPEEVAPGAPIAVLHVPRWGSDYQRVVVEGTTEAQLAQGPGHYVGTAMPGRPGNVALAGHRVGEGSPFLDLDTLRPGDPVVLETVDTWFVYRVLGDPSSGDVDADPSGIPGRQIVAPEDVRVISPTPNGPPDAAPTGAYLTLTTCHPLFSARERLVVHAALEGTGVPKSTAPGGPPALRGR